MTKTHPKFKFSEYFGAWRNPFQNAKKKLFLTLTLISRFLRSYWTTFDTLYLLVTSKLTLDSLLKVNQNQIFFPMVPKFLHFEKKKLFTMM